MTFCWSIHLYPPVHNCGAEYMAHWINKYLMSRGHHTRVVLHQANRYKITRGYEYDGVQVIPPIKNMLDTFRMSNILFTHLDYTGRTISWGKQVKRPVVQFIHNTHRYDSIMENPHVNVVYNSHWAKKELDYVNNGFVLTPPCNWRYYDVNEDPEGNEYITLINLDHNKGGHILAEIAKRFPDKKFLGVMGSYSVDDNGQFIKQPGNVKVIPNTPNILEVYKKTRVLIMPSLYESWGRTATESMCNGIPVVVSATQGLSENCDYAGLYVHDRDDIEQWVRWIKRLDDKRFYKGVSEKCRQRSRDLDPVVQLGEFEKWLTSIK